MLWEPSEPTQTFTDDLNRNVVVPVNPKRIVSLHDLDITIPLIELGVPPVASHGRTRPDGSHFLRSSGMLTGIDFDNSDITFIGTADIDIEAIAAAKPDLIITEPTRNTPVEQLEKIAPTVSIDHLDGGAPEIYRKLAQLTGTAGAAEDSGASLSGADRGAKGDHRYEQTDRLGDSGQSGQNQRHAQLPLAWGACCATQGSGSRR